AVRVGQDIAGYIWFVPKQASGTLPALSLWVSIGAVLLGTLVFGALLYWLVLRTIGRPLRRIGDAAARVGTGDYRVRLPALAGMRELDALVASFNAMAGKVQGHTGDLERAVQQAVEAEKQKERALVVSGRLAAVGTLAAGI